MQRAGAGKGAAVDRHRQIRYMTAMIDEILSQVSVAVGCFEDDPAAVINAAADGPIAVIANNKPAAYLISPQLWEAVLDRIEDAELTEIVRARPPAFRSVLIDDL